MRTINKGVKRALFAALLFGLSAPIAKALVGSVPPQFLAGLLYLGSGSGLLLLRWFRRNQAEYSHSQMSRAELPYFVGAIAAGGVLAPVLLMYGLQHSPAGASALLLNLEAVFTTLIAWLIFRENIGGRIFLGTMAIIAGSVVLSWSSESIVLAELVGPLSVAGACLCWAVDNNLTQKISAGEPFQIASWKGLIGGTINIAAAWIAGQRTDFGAFVFVALALGFVSYGISLVLYILALRDLGTARAGNYFSFSPFVGAVAGLVLFHESLTARLLGSGILMGSGIWLHMTEVHAHSHVHEAMFHEHLHIHDAHHQHEHGPLDPPGEPHSHPHRHERLEHAHSHYPDIHHLHEH